MQCELLQTVKLFMMGLCRKKMFWSNVILQSPAKRWITRLKRGSLRHARFSTRRSRIYHLAFMSRGGSCSNLAARQKSLFKRTGKKSCRIRLWFGTSWSSRKTWDSELDIHWWCVLKVTRQPLYTAGKAITFCSSCFGWADWPELFRFFFGNSSFVRVSKQLGWTMSELL